MKLIKQTIGGRDLVTVDRHMTVLEVVRRMSEHGIGAVPVIDGERVVGIFTERDVMARVVAAERDPRATSVAEVMSTDLLVAEADDTHETCLRSMQRARVRHMLVLDAGRLAGIVSLRDLLAVEIGEKDEALNMLNAYVNDIPLNLTPNKASS